MAGGDRSEAAGTSRRVLRVALTGGIGSGKSRVSRRLAELGAVVVDADLLARRAVDPGTPGLAAVVDTFGDGVLAADGSLDRAALADVVFADPAALGRLEAIVHPEVRRLALAAEAAAPDGSVVVQDRPLLVERPTRDTFDAVVVVDCDPETQVRRLVTDRGMTEEEARARMAAQATREQRLAVADEVVANDGTVADLDAATDALWERLQARARRRSMVR